MGDWMSSEYWEGVACVLRVCAGYQNVSIMTSVMCSVNTVKATRHDLDSCNKDYEVVASRKGHMMLTASTCWNSPNNCKTSRWKIWESGLWWERWVLVTTMKLTLQWDFYDHLYKRCRGHILTAKVKENCKKALEQAVESGIVWFFLHEKNFSQIQLHNKQNNRWLV